MGLTLFQEKSEEEGTGKRQTKTKAVTGWSEKALKTTEGEMKVLEELWPRE